MAAAAFYDQITREVQAACRDGRLSCQHGLISYLPAVTQDQWRQGPSKIRTMVELLLGQRPLEPAPESAGSPEQLIPALARRDGDRSSSFSEAELASGRTIQSTI